jgi:sensor domain CHASE-containing protein
MATNKQVFIGEIEAIVGQLSTEAAEYFNTVIKARKVNKKEQEKAQVVRDAILAFLERNRGNQRMFDRTEIGDELFNAAEFDEEFLLNDKGTVAYNSITAFANQLVTDGKIQKFEVKVGKSTKVKYAVE